MTANHKDMTGTSLHEPKGVSGASANEVYIADGAASGAYSAVAGDILSSTGENTGRILVADGANGVGYQTLVWKDILGLINPKASGAGSPARTVYRTNVYDFAWAINDQADINYHIPHDYAPGTDIHLHVHWSHTGTNISGTLETTSYTSYAKGHNQEIFTAEVAPVCTASGLTIGGYPQYQHILSEIQLSAATPSSTQIDSDSLEPDGIVMTTTKLTTLPTITGGNLFIHYLDIHYQAAYIGTKNKAPDFYV